MNEILWAVMLVVNFAMIMCFFRIWGKTGLFVWMAISCIIANIQVTKNVSLFSLESTLGNAVYATSFLATDILSEFYGKSEAKKAVYFGLSSLICMTILMSIAVAFTPSSSDVSSSSLSTIFSFMPRIALSSLVAYTISNLHDVWSYDFWHKITGDRFLFIRNNISTWISQAIDTIIFTLGAFYGVYSKSVLIQIMISTYVLKWVVALCDTALIYLAKYWVSHKTIKDIA